jgi:tetratricopeptide (TPR) repeat protein
LWQVLGIYLGASWLMLQVVDTLAGALSLPDWSASFALFALIIGLPIVLATAFVQQGVTKRATVAPEPAVSDEGGGAPAPQPDSDPGASSHRRRHLFSWRNAILFGVGAFALLGLLSAAWLASRALGVGPAATLQARGVIDDRALVVLADFDSTDPEIGAAATEALRVDLSQSGAIQLADRSLISDALRRMERDPAEPLTAQIAEELARREGAGAVIQGQISRAGEGYVFSAQLVATDDGSTLTSQRETAGGPGEVIDAIEELSGKLRERIGESLGSIRAGDPLARVTTDNLDALELYSRGQRTGGREALLLYEEAVALDPGFAMAWSGIAVLLRNQMAERARALEARTRAYELRDRLTRRERHLTAANYFLEVEIDLERASREYEAMLELDPLDQTAINNVGLVYGELRDNVRAEESYLRFIALNPDEFAPGYWNLIQTQIHLGKFDDAWATIDTVAVKFPGVSTEYLGALVASNEGDLERASGLLRELVATAPTGFWANANGDLSTILGTLGQVDEARAAFDGVAAFTRESAPAEYWEDVIQGAWLELAVRNRADDALELVDTAESLVPLASLAALDRPYGSLVELLARAGSVARARELFAEIEQEIPAEFLTTTKRELARAEGEIALAEERFDEAIAAFRRSDTGYCTICALTGLGAAYDAAGKADSAIAVFTRYAETPFPDRYASYAYPLGPALGPTLERLGQLHDQQGNLNDAALYLAKFVELWADADAELQPRVSAAQARLEEILGEIG